MENKNQIYLFAVRFEDENGYRYGLPFPGTVETMKRDVRESLKGFDAEMVKHYTVEFLCEYHCDMTYPIVLLPDIEEFSYRSFCIPVSDILAEVSVDE